MAGAGTGTAHGEPVDVSIVIPVYEHWEPLAHCLEELRTQDYEGPVEIVVVDNGSTTPAPPRLPGEERIVRCRCDTPGSYAARNHGIAVASGAILAFIDADCVPRPDWLRRGVAALAADPEADAAGGRVEVVAPRPGARTMIETFELWCGFPQHVYVRRGFSGAGNLFVRREVFERVGTFDETLMSGGDKEWGQRLTRAGGRVVYADDAVVAHAARTTRAELGTKIARLVGGRWAAIRGPWQAARASPAMVLPPPRPLAIALGPGRVPLRDRGHILAVLGLIWYLKLAALLRLLRGGRPGRV